MSLPEITAFCRVLARSKPEDKSQQARNLERLHELRGYLGPHADPGLAACMEASSEVMGLLATGMAPTSEELLTLVCKLMATVEKNWTGPDPDAEIVQTLYADAAGAPDAEEREIESLVHGAKTAAFVASDIEEAQRRVESLKGTPRINEMVLGELLVELGHATEEEVQSGLEEQARTGELLGQVLIARGVVTEHLVEETVQFQVRLRSESTLASMTEPVEEPAPPKPAPGLRLALDEARRQQERGNDNNLGAILLRQGAISAQELERALAMQRASGLRLGETLVEMHATGWETINRAIDLQKRLRNAAGIGPRASLRFDR